MNKSLSTNQNHRSDSHSISKKSKSATVDNCRGYLSSNRVSLTQQPNNKTGDQISTSVYILYQYL
jgi:hypothetical protein